MRDLYEVLGVSRTGDADQIRRAYRTLALQCHPDRNQGSKEAEERFKELAEAFGTLGDPEQRSAYDRLGHAGLGRAAGPEPPGPDLAEAVEVFVEQFSAFVQDELRGKQEPPPAFRIAATGPPAQADRDSRGGRDRRS